MFGVLMREPEFPGVLHVKLPDEAIVASEIVDGDDCSVSSGSREVLSLVPMGEGARELGLLALSCGVNSLRPRLRCRRIA